MKSYGPYYLDPNKKYSLRLNRQKVGANKRLFLSLNPEEYSRQFPFK